jgi:hypothetical protein
MPLSRCHCCGRSFPILNRKDNLHTCGPECKEEMKAAGGKVVYKKPAKRRQRRK